LIVIWSTMDGGSFRDVGVLMMGDRVVTSRSWRPAGEAAAPPDAARRGTGDQPARAGVSSSSG
jgi:hypothetical protein